MPLQMGIYVLLLGNQGARAENYFWCLRYASQLSSSQKKKKILMPKWHILIPYSPNMLVLPNTQGGDEMARVETLCRLESAVPRSGIAISMITVSRRQSRPHPRELYAQPSKPRSSAFLFLPQGPVEAFYREDTSKPQRRVFIVQRCTSCLFER